MNTFLYPYKDTYISSEEKTKNFGIDEILNLKSKNSGEILKTNPNTNWVIVPESPSSIGKVGDVAYDESGEGFYAYVENKTFSGWKYFTLPEGISEYKTRFLDFTGEFYNTGSQKVILSGSTYTLDGYFTGSIRTDSYVILDGYCTTGSFFGTVKSGSEFELLVVNDLSIQSPLEEDVTGTGFFTKFTGSLEAIFTTGKGNICFGEGYYEGNIKASDFVGEIVTNDDSISHFDVTNTNIFSEGGYSGSINPIGLPEYFVNSPSMSRILTQFDLTEVKEGIQSGDITDPVYHLRMIACSQINVPFNYNVYTYPISQSWEGGNGRLYSDISATDGVSWLYRDYTDGNTWYDYDLTSSWKSVNYFDNPEYVTESFMHGGGTWYTTNPDTGESLQCSQSFQRNSQGDIGIDVTKIVNAWNDDIIPNNGFILMLSNEVVEHISNKFNTNTDFEFYSRDTNTIYSPALQISWDDSEFKPYGESGSLEPLDLRSDILITLPNITETYKSGEVVKITVFGRNKYQLKEFYQDLQQPYMLIPKYLPEKTYYQLRDAESEMVIYNFGEYTKVSCNEYGNYFYFDTTGIPLERYYRFAIKSIFEDGTVRIFNIDKIFKVIR